MNEVYVKNLDVVFRSIAGEFILVPIRHRAVDLKSVYTLNGSAAFVWGLIDGKRPLGQIIDRLVEEFNVETAQARADVLEIIAQLEGLSLIQKP